MAVLLAVGVYKLRVALRWKMVVWAVAIYYAGAFFVFRIVMIYPDSAHGPLGSRSIAIAKSRGSFVTEARLEPTRFVLEGEEVEFEEAWVEEAMATKLNILLLPYEAPQGWYFFCFRTKNKPSWRLLFVLEGNEKKHGFSGRHSYSERAPYPEIFTLHVCVLRSWKDENPVKISIERKE
jgi:hypothetical protein